MKRVAGLVLLLVLLAAAPVHADRGSIPFDPDVKIFEPTQRAMIAWDGVEEILLLSTDLRASRRTKVLEVLPLPAEPVVKKGDVEVFRKATALINRKLRMRRPRAGARKSLGEGARQGPAGEVTFHKKIGAHDISVTRVLDSAGFIRWVESYLRRAGVRKPRIPAPLKTVVGEYLRDGFRWFVFDVVELGPKTLTNDAIQYRFRSDAVFYPLRITRTEVGDTSIELLILTPKLLSHFPGLPVERVELRHDPIPVTSKEIRGLCDEMDALLGRRDNMKLRIWRIRGRLNSFRDDLIARTARPVR